MPEPDEKEDPKKKSQEKKTEKKVVIKKITPLPTTETIQAKKDTFQRFEDGSNQQNQIFRRSLKITVTNQDKTNKEVKILPIKEVKGCLEGCICNSDVVVDSDGFIINDKVIKNKIESCNKGGSLEKVKIIVLHRTAGGGASGTLGWMKQAGYGAHFVIDNAKNSDGNINHAISLNKKGSHMGAGKFSSTKDKGWGNHNSIGIEVCGYSFDKSGEKRVGNNTNAHSYWENVTEKQAQSVACLVKFLIKHFDLTLDDVKCHEDLCHKDPNEGKDVYNAMMKYW